MARVTVAPGAQVSAGQTIAVLRPSPQSSLDLAKAEADARAGADALARARRLRATGLDSDADVETARQTAATASATLAAQRARQAGLVVRAPASGVVETLTASLGRHDRGRERTSARWAGARCAFAWAWIRLRRARSAAARG